MAWLWWVGAALIFALIELLSLDFVFIMFAGGALAASVANAAGTPLWVQAVVFVVASVVLLVTLRPTLIRHLRNNTPKAPTNAEANVGRSASVVQDVTTASGLIKLSGEVWSARSVPGSPLLPAGTSVRVVQIDGATAVVEPEA
ncbi:NfeD family protein [Promicromonospora sp. NPDC050880]|uniref:NfeD family protein n=1 Tax=unclassified Promicromonospora TaxID=2647929 RepID=UPI0037AC9AAC